MSTQQTFPDVTPGVSNRFAPDALATRLASNIPATYMRDAVNCDLTSKGKLLRRQGYTNLSELPARCVWGDGKPDGYAVVAGQVSRLTFTPALVVEPLAAAAPGHVSFSRAPDGSVVWSDGVSIQRVSQTSAPLVPQTPAVPDITVGSGALPAGRYMLASTLFSASGEGAPTWPVQVDVPAGGSITLSGLTPGSRIYATGPNGEVMTYVGASILGSFVYSVIDDTGWPLDTAGLVAMPPGRIVRHALGRLLVASGNTLFMSEAFRHGLYNPAGGFISFKAPITVVAPTSRGVYVCADQTYWFDSLPPQASPAVLPFGAVFGSDVAVPGPTEGVQRCAWMSPRGMVSASEAGEVELVQDAALNFSPAARASTVLRESAGERWFVSSRSGVGPMISKAPDAGT